MDIERDICIYELSIQCSGI